MLSHSFTTLFLSALLSNILGSSASVAGLRAEQDVFITEWQTRTVTMCPYSIPTSTLPCSLVQSSSRQPYSTSLTSSTSSTTATSSASSSVVGSPLLGTTTSFSSSSATMTSSSSSTSSSSLNAVGPGLISTTSTTITTSTSSSTSTTTSPASSPTDVTFDGNNYIVAGLGSFKNMRHFVFNTSTLPNGLYASNYTVNDTADGLPYNHMFDPVNVYTDGGFVNLRVPADPNPQPGSTVSCGELTTTENDIMYASVRTRAIFSTVYGTCHGNFFYRNDNEECDIEYLTDPSSQSNPGPGQPIPLWLTNQALSSGGQPTQGTSPAPQDVTVVHEYRIDWVQGYTAFYVDGQLLKKYTSNVPNKSGSWVWNNWSNGDPGWSVGPPTQDSIFKIQDIRMYYNTASN